MSSSQKEDGKGRKKASPRKTSPKFSYKRAPQVAETTQAPRHRWEWVVNLFLEAARISQWLQGHLIKYEEQ